MPDYRKIAEPAPLPPSIGWGGAPEGMSLAALAQYLPQLTVQSRGVGRPKVGGELNIPVGQGTIGVEGYYHRLAPQDPADAGAFLRYNRSF